jgi:NAD(P)-dependent dehydrogenase (short-subunit alcohol dehydrogenase family)
MGGIDFSGRVVVITGAGGGLGRTYALEIARRGGAVVANDLGGNVDGENPSPSMADSVVAEIVAAGGRAVANYDSVVTTAGAQAIIEKALSTFGRVDAVINNAGTLNNGWFEDVTEEVRNGLFATHLAGTYNVTPGRI